MRAAVLGHVEWLGAARRSPPPRRAFTFLDAGGERAITTLGERLHPCATDALPWEQLGEVDCVYVCAADAEVLRLARRARVVVATSRVADLLAEAGVRLGAVGGGASHPPAALAPR